MVIEPPRLGWPCARRHRRVGRGGRGLPRLSGSLNRCGRRGRGRLRRRASRQGRHETEQEHGGADRRDPQRAAGHGTTRVRAMCIFLLLDHEGLIVPVRAENAHANAADKEPERSDRGRRRQGLTPRAQGRAAALPGERTKERIQRGTHVVNCILNYTVCHREQLEWIAKVTSGGRAGLAGGAGTGILRAAHLLVYSDEHPILQRRRLWSR